MNSRHSQLLAHMAWAALLPALVALNTDRNTVSPASEVLSTVSGGCSTEALGSTVLEGQGSMVDNTA